MNKKKSFLALIMACTFLVACSGIQPNIVEENIDSQVGAEQGESIQNDSSKENGNLDKNEKTSLTDNNNTPKEEIEPVENSASHNDTQNSQDSLSSEPLAEPEKEIAKAMKFEEYLITNLSEEIYGGLYTDGYYETTFYIWVIDDVAVKAVIDSYPETPCKVVKLEGNYSLKSLREYEKELYTIPYEQTNFALFGVEQRENLIVSTIPEDDSLGLKKLVDQKMIAANIPNGCVKFEIIEDFGYGVLA